MTLGWRWSLVYKIYGSKVEFPFPVSLTLSYSQHQSHISFGTDQIPLSEAQCQQFGFALVGPLPPAAAKPPQKFSFKKLFAAKIKASETSQGDETACFNFSTLRLRLFLETEDLQCTCCQRRFAEDKEPPHLSSQQHGWWVFISAVSVKSTSLQLTLSPKWVYAEMFDIDVEGPGHIIFCWLARAHLLLPLDPDMKV